MHGTYSFQSHVKSNVLKVPVSSRWQGRGNVKLFLEVEKLK